MTSYPPGYDLDEECCDPARIPHPLRDETALLEKASCVRTTLPVETHSELLKNASHKHNPHVHKEPVTQMHSFNTSNHVDFAAIVLFKYFNIDKTYMCNAQGARVLS